MSQYWRIRGVRSASFILKLLNDLALTRPLLAGRVQHLSHRLPQPFKVSLHLLQGSCLSSEFNPSSDPRRKQEDGGDEQTDGKGAEDRLVNVRGGRAQSEEITEGDLLLLILEEEGQGEQQQDANQDEPDHSGNFVLFGLRPEPCLSFPAS